MTFSVKGLFYFVGFLMALALALNAPDGGIAPWLAMAGMAAIVLVDWVLTFWPAIVGRSRERNHGRSS
jgi:integral membrane sensor domain MASE1